MRIEHEYAQLFRVRADGGSSGEEAHKLTWRDVLVVGVLVVIGVYLFLLLLLLLLLHLFVLNLRCALRQPLGPRSLMKL